MPFTITDNEKLRRLNTALLIFLTFIALVFSLIVPGIGIAGAALMPVPATLLLLGGRVRDSILCAVLSIALLAILDYILAILVIAAVIAVAFNYKDTTGHDRNIMKTVSVNFGIFFAVVLLYIILFSAIHRINYISQALGTFNSYIDSLPADPLVSAYSSLAAVDREQLDLLIKQVQDMMRMMPNILPGIGIVSFALISMLNYIFSFEIFKRYRIEIRPFKSFSDWELPWYFCWGIIFGLVLLLIPSTGGSIDRLIDIISYNLLIIFGAIYLVLGISVLTGLFKRLKLSLLWRVVIFAVLGFFTGFAVILIPIMGLIDIWANFRRLKRI
ncbi:MAG: DUF2232 domain-containing protein [Actinobacteria bacterium]|nr:DUF2232 domain-containing protein [Actinomycetota bacterium]